MTMLLLTQAHCAFCEQARAIIDRLATEYDLTVSTLDLATAEGQVRAEAAGMLFAPGVFLDDVPFSYGRLSERKLRRAIERRRAVAGEGGQDSP